MSYVFKTKLANKKNYGSKRKLTDIKWLGFHYTANDGDTDEANANYFANNTPIASANYFVDDDSVTQTVPDDYVAYAVGGAKYPNTKGGKYYGTVRNSNSIHIEMCDTIKDGKHNVSEATKKNALALAKSLMLKYSIDINHVVRHYDVTGKNCPSYLVDEVEWNKFKLELQAELNNSIIKNIEVTMGSNIANGVYTQDDFIKDVCKILKVNTSQEALAKTITLSKNINNTNPLITPIERYLKSLGYYTGSIEADNGKTPLFGSGLKRAVEKYQTYVVKYTKVKNIDGIITAKGGTWKKLLKLG